MTLQPLDDTHTELRASIRRLARERIAPHATHVDEQATYPWESWKAWSEAGFASLPFPVEHGGQGGTHLAHAIAMEEVARVCGSSSLFVLISKVAMSTVIEHGSSDLKQRVLMPVATGAAQASYCLSEEGAGSDITSMQTRAVRDGDTYVLNGRKMWITNAGVSDHYTVFAKTDPDAGHRGISAIVVPADAPGLSIGKLESKMGMRGSPTGEVILDDCVVPVTNLVGQEGSGFYYAMAALDSSRPLIGAQAVGLAQGALDVATEYVLDRRQFDERIADFQGVRFMLADMVTQLEAARGLVYMACRRLDDGLEDTAQSSSMAKMFASDVAMRVTTDAVQLLGGAGYTRDFPVERMMRDCKVTQIYEGTNQIQRVVVAKRHLERYT